MSQERVIIFFKNKANNYFSDGKKKKHPAEAECNGLKSDIHNSELFEGMAEITVLPETLYSPEASALEESPKILMRERKAYALLTDYCLISDA